MAISLRPLAEQVIVITGASSGIGREIVRLLARDGVQLVVSARNESALNELAAAVAAKHHVDIRVVPADLSESDGASELASYLSSHKIVVNTLVNNAGFGTSEYFVDIRWADIAKELNLNVVNLTELTWLCAGAMRARKGGYILNVASIGAYTPTPSYATYSAGKAYVRDFTEAIAAELADTGVRVCCLCPGGTLTEFHQASGHNELSPMVRATFMTAERCARIGLSALFSGRRNVVSGASNKAMMWMLRFMPRRAIVWMSGVTMGRPKPATALPSASE